MRIIGGAWRGRSIRAPKGARTRPTTDRVREALFSALSARLDLADTSVLDVFAGSGALGLEALSRGAARATFVENDRAALGALADNVRSFGAEKLARVVAGDAFSLARRGFPGAPFALILLDPPYTLDAAEVGRLLSDLADTGSIDEGAVVSWEHGSNAPARWPEGFEPIAEKRYGTTTIELGRFERGATDR